MKSFESYLSKKYRPATVGRYLRARDTLIDKLEIQGAQQAKYRQVLDHLGELRNRGLGPAHIATELAGLKAYFRYLVSEGVRVDDPTRNIHIKDDKHKAVQFQELFSREELELLLERPTRYQLLKWRNKLAISLYIYQGLLTGELVRLCVGDLDLERGEVFVRASPKSCSRTLPLDPRQVLFAERYLVFDRPQLMHEETDALFLGKRGEIMDGGGLHYLVESMRTLFPDRTLNPMTIRQSVLVNLFKQDWDVRDVQVFAGHRYASTTERYQPVDVSALEGALDRWHPLG